MTRFTGNQRSSTNNKLWQVFKGGQVLGQLTLNQFGDKSLATVAALVWVAKEGFSQEDFKVVKGHLYFKQVQSREDACFDAD